MWTPYPKQEIALTSDAYEILYGGARGGGKTDTGIAWLTYNVGNPLFRALVIRKSFTDLTDWKDRAEAKYSLLGAKYVKDSFIFPSGAKIVLGHLNTNDAYRKYQGHEYQNMLIEELTHIPSERLYLQLISSCRSTIGIPAQVFSTSNPGEVGHRWVKARFISPSLAMRPFSDPISGRKRIFIPATVDDNPTLMQADPDYVKFLESLPDDIKAQWRYGSWEDQKVVGAYFDSDLRQAEAEGRISDLMLLPNHQVHVSWDLGLNDTQISWFYQLHGEEIRVIDLNFDSDKGFDYYPQMLKAKGYNYGTMVLPHDGVKRSADTRRSFKQVLDEVGYQTKIVERTKDKNRDINAVRRIFPRVKIDETKCAKGIEALYHYHREWNEQKQMYLEEPYHDWSSHFADAFMAMALSVPNQVVASHSYEKAAQALINPRKSNSELGLSVKDHIAYQKEAQRLIQAGQLIR